MKHLGRHGGMFKTNTHKTDVRTSGLNSIQGNGDEPLSFHTAGFVLQFWHPLNSRGWDRERLGQIKAGPDQCPHGVRCRV